MIRADVLEVIRGTELPLPKRTIRRAYLFGSSLHKDDYNDIDLAVFISPKHEIFNNALLAYSTQIGKVELHILPDYWWYRNRLKQSSVTKRIPKRHLKGKRWAF